METRLGRAFFEQDVLEMAPQLLGKRVVRMMEDGRRVEGIITEVEAYRGEEDLASHARFGKTKRNLVMYGEAGVVYMYLIYGMYWMFNIVTGMVDNPQAVLIRGLDEVSGPGRVAKYLGLDRTFYGEDLVTSERLWIENGMEIWQASVIATERIGIDYAGEWARKLWRWVIKLA